jgi:uncharacterized membrane protein
MLMLSGALIRQSFVLRHRALATGQPVPWAYAIVGAVLLAGVVGAAMPTALPAASATSAAPTFAQVRQVVTQRCVLCHNEQMASKGIQLDTPELLLRNAQAAYQQAAVLKVMPMNNATQMTPAERELLKRWFEAGAAH